MLSFLPNKYQNYLKQIDLLKLYEIRLRENYKVKINVDNNFLDLAKGQVVCLREDIDEILKNVTESSLYAYNDCLKNGFLTTKKGVRIGVAGECVYDSGNVITIKNISSLNIRVPHIIIGSAKNIYQVVLDKGINSTLIISPPFYGKTTMLKDLILMLNSTKKYNLLVVDERNEFCEIKGEFIDCIKYCSKEYAFSYGIRSMSPDVIITDELMGLNDWKSVETAINSGVKVIASCHGKDLYNVINKQSFISGLFERYVVINSLIGQAGIVDKIYDGEYKII